MSPDSAQFQTLVLAGVIFWITGELFFRFSPGAMLKRILLPIYHVSLVVFAGLLFWRFVGGWRFLSEKPVFLIVAPALALICFLNIRSTRFCDSCARMIFERPLTRRRRVCECGASLG